MFQSTFSAISSFLADVGATAGTRMIHVPKSQRGGIMDIFRGPATPAPQPPTNPNVQVNAPTGVANPGQPMPGTQASQQTAPNGTVPVQDPNLNPGNPGNSDASPLAAFNDIWQTPPNAAGNTPAPMFANVTPEALQAAAGKVNFAQTLTPELMQKIAAGGQDSIQAFSEAMNKVAQSVYAQSALATTKIVEQALGKQSDQFNSQLPTMVKKLSANDNLLATNPLLNSPAVQPIVQALQEQYVRKYPNATSAEIQSQVVDYMTALGKTFGTPPVDTSKQGGNTGDQDWSKFFS